MRDGVLKADAACMQADAAVGVATRSSVLEVAANGASDSCKLAAYLVVATCMEVHFEQMIAFRVAYDLVVEHGLLGAGALVGVGERFVLLLVANDVVRKRRLLLAWRILYECPIGLVHALGAEKVVQSSQCLAGASEDNNAADGTIQTMNHTKEHFARFGIAFLDVCFHQVGEWRVAGLVALNNLARLLRDDDDMVVFVENFQLSTGCFQLRAKGEPYIFMPPSI